MTSHVTPEFWTALNSLPSSVQHLARKNYLLWRNDPQHSSIRFKYVGTASGPPALVSPTVPSLLEKVKPSSSIGSGTIQNTISSSGASRADIQPIALPQGLPAGQRRIALPVEAKVLVAV